MRWWRVGGSEEGTEPQGRTYLPSLLGAHLIPDPAQGDQRHMVARDTFQALLGWAGWSWVGPPGGLLSSGNLFTHRWVNSISTLFLLMKKRDCS